MVRVVIETHLYYFNIRFSSACEVSLLLGPGCPAVPASGTVLVWALKVLHPENLSLSGRLGQPVTLGTEEMTKERNVSKLKEFTAYLDLKLRSLRLRFF